MKKTILLAVMAGLLSACGIKPNNVDPPEEVQRGEFPRTYPDLSTDPPPFTAP